MSSRGNGRVGMASAMDRVMGLLPNGTRLLLGLLIGFTALFAVLYAQVGTRLPAVEWLTVFPGMMPTGILTNSFVAAPGSPLNLLIFVGLGVWLNKAQARYLWHTRRNAVLAWSAGSLVFLYLVDTFVLIGHGWGLATELLFVGVFAVPLERRWGTRRLLLFTLWLVLAVGAFGFVITWLWPGWILAPLAGDGVSLLSGSNNIMMGLITAYLLMIGGRRLQGINIEAYKLIWVLVALCVLNLIFRSMASGLMGLMAIVVARMLISGTWRPNVLMDRLRLWRLERRQRKRRSALHVIDGGKTLH